MKPGRLRVFEFVTLVAVLSSALFLMTGSANAGPLLKSTSTVEPLAVEQKFKADKTLKRKRLVEVDPAVLETEILPRGADKSSSRAEQSTGLAGEVTLELFRGLSVTLRARHVEGAFGGGVVWSADAGGEDYGILVVNNGKITGSIEAKGRSFLIEPTGRGNEHRVREVDPEAFPNDMHLDVASAPKTTGGGKGGGKGGGGGGGDSGGGGTITPPPPTGTIQEITLLATYTSRVNTMFGGAPADRIALDVAIVNRGFVNSGVPLHLSLAGVAAVSSAYDEKSFSNKYQPLYDITSGTGYNFPALRSERDTLKADFVTIYADRSEYCGSAWVSGLTLYASYAFSVINPACNGTPTLAHEMGHNMGLYHDRYVEAASSSSLYNYGYVSTAGKFRDIMSYNNACSALGFTCQRITYYSNPNLLYNGYALGIPQYTDGAADATRKLAENAAAASALK